jgi:hypothetical protein
VSALLKLLPLVLWIVLAYFVWISVGDNEVQEVVEESAPPNLVIEDTDGSVEADIDSLQGSILLEPSDDR